MNNPTHRSAGLRRFISQPDEFGARYGNFTLTARDYEILHLIYRYRYLEARHIRALIAGSGQQITRRLQGLFHNRYIRRYAARHRMRPDLDPGAPLIAYGLELRGARVIASRPSHILVPDRHESEPVRWKKDYTRRTEWFLEHHLMVSNFHCVLELALRERPKVELVNWEQGQGIRLKATVSDNQRRVVRIAPDACFALRDAGQIRQFFLEFDRSTEEHARLLRKFLAYWWYLQSSDFLKASAGGRRANVLFVTTGHQRMLNLMESLRRMSKPNRAKHGGKGLFWFGCEVEYNTDLPNSVLGKIWRSIGNSSLSLFE